MSVVLYHFEALTGLNIRGDIRRRDILTGLNMFRGAIADVYLLRGENKTIAVVGEDLKVSADGSMNMLFIPDCIGTGPSLSE